MAYEITTNPLTGVEAHPGSGHYAVYDHGAHVWAWQPDGQRPVLWMSAQSMFVSGQPIRGGVPVIFPWFGMGQGGDKKPAHGFVRLHEWNRTRVVDTLGSDGKLIVEYAIDPSRTGHPEDWPSSYAATLTVEFTPTYLQVGMEVSNGSTHPFTFEQALHTYLAVSDVRNVTVTGLEGADYLDKVAGRSDFDTTQDGPVTITAETDRVYRYPGTVILHDPGWQRKLEISKEGSADLVVWNPWTAKSAAMPDFGDDEWPSMICIEAVNALDDAVHLPPGSSAVMSQRITLA